MPEKKLSDIFPRTYIKDPAVVVSVPYSGTRYVKESLGLDGSIHTYDTPERMYEYLGKYDTNKLIIPIRDPQDNWNSRARRWPKGRPWDRCIAEYERSWTGLAWILSNPDFRGWLVPIDKPGTDQTLQVIACMLKIPFRKPAERIGSKDEGDNVYSYDCSHIYKYDFVREFYQSPFKKPYRR